MPPKKGWLEKREFTRLKDTIKVVYYPVDDTRGIGSNSSDYKNTTIEMLKNVQHRGSLINAITEDISRGGLSILSGEPLQKGQKIIVDLFISSVQKPVKILSEVCHVEKNIKGASAYRAGLKILSLSRSDISRIQDHILKLKNRY
ncbi:MAG: PilZ domain-containing protein [bacterium]